MGILASGMIGHVVRVLPCGKGIRRAITHNQFEVYFEFSVNYTTILMYYYKKVATLEFVCIKV